MLHAHASPFGPDLLRADDAIRLLAAARDLAAARTVGRVMEVVRRAARELTAADGVTFVLREGDVVHYADEDAIAPLWKGCRFPATACISGWAMLHREVVVIEDIYADERIPHAAYRPTFVRSLAMVPVGSDEPVAAIGAYWARHHRATDRQLELLETLAGLAAVALTHEALVADLRGAVQARDDFIDIAWHETRTPIAAVRLQLERALRAGDRGDAAAARAATERAYASTLRLAKLVETLLEVPRAGEARLAVERRPFDLAALAREVVERQREVAACEVSFAADGEVRGAWDRPRVEQVIENLVANAVKFGNGEPVAVQVTARDGIAQVAVEDRGIGIAPEDQARIFGRFERAAPRTYTGFGLGLWIARRNVEAHGGSLSVSSRPGAGSTFTVRLPL